jgi:hypothetical protein
MSIILALGGAGAAEPSLDIALVGPAAAQWSFFVRALGQPKAKLVVTMIEVCA